MATPNEIVAMTDEEFAEYVRAHRNSVAALDRLLWDVEHAQWNDLTPGAAGKERRDAEWRD